MPSASISLLSILPIFTLLLSTIKLLLRPDFQVTYPNTLHNLIWDLPHEPQILIIKERFVVRCMIFMKNVLSNTQYKLVSSKQVPNERLIEAIKLLKSFFTPETLLNLCKVLITRYFILTPEELEEWKDDPEEFIRESETDSVQDNLKVEHTIKLSYA